ncbi:DUF421 domain-containing protein [Paenibacillus lemnae]|uniref:DUF421 domain-containing protein n=1 Tax=Paenibacillus lemnae TaxID=1330551 RepID=A0A848M8A9_PAELE|nr:YetF domain-containing protein [Paenibacillus lemnae]NMO96430.1 DUF421 domain-containing protein [Paenibacillus lemnae]
MNVILVLKSIGIVILGTLLFRIGGRKSIAQMSITQVIIMISIGSLLVYPLREENYWVTMGLAGVLVLTMLAMEFIEFYVNRMETLISGKAVLVIVQGQFHEQNLKRLRLTVDKLEMRLRQVGINRISDVEWATLEVSGNIGYALKPEKQPATREDLNRIVELLQQLHPDLKQQPPPQPAESSPDNNIFTELVRTKENSNPEKWQ